MSCLWGWLKEGCLHWANLSGTEYGSEAFVHLFVTPDRHWDGTEDLDAELLSSTWGSGCFGLAASCRQHRHFSLFLRAAGPQYVAGGFLCLAGMWSLKCNCQTLCSGIFKADDYWLMSASTGIVCSSKTARPRYECLWKSHREMLCIWELHLNVADPPSSPII